MAVFVVAMVMVWVSCITASLQGIFAEVETDAKTDFPNEYCRFAGQYMPHPHSPCMYLKCMMSEKEDEEDEGFLYSREVACPRGLAVDDRVFTIMNNYMIADTCTVPDDRCEKEIEDSEKDPSYSGKFTTPQKEVEPEDEISLKSVSEETDSRQGHIQGVDDSLQLAADDPTQYTGWQSYGRSMPGHHGHFVSLHQVRNQIQSKYLAKQPQQGQQLYFTTTPAAISPVSNNVNNAAASPVQGLSFYTPQPTVQPTQLPADPAQHMRNTLERYQQMVAQHQQAAIKAQQLNMKLNAQRAQQLVTGGSSGTNVKSAVSSKIEGIEKNPQNQQQMQQQQQHQHVSGQFSGYQSIASGGQGSNSGGLRPAEFSHPVIHHKLHPTYRLPIQAGPRGPPHPGYTNNRETAVPSNSVPGSPTQDSGEKPSVDHPTFFRLIKPNNPNTRVSNADPNSNVYKKLTDDIDLPGAKYVYMDPVPGYYLVYPTVSE